MYEHFNIYTNKFHSFSLKKKKKKSFNRALQNFATIREHLKTIIMKERKKRGREKKTNGKNN